MSDIVNVKLSPGGQMPLRATEASNGMDLFALLDTPVMIRAGERLLVPTGVHLGMHSGIYALVLPRSGLAAKYGVTVLNAPGLIDTDFRGEIKVILINHGSDQFRVDPKDRVAQLLFSRPVALQHVWELDDTTRGSNGFGSSGR